MDQVEPFPDNWTYIRTELNWLDRLLATAIARQRKEVKEIDRVARSRADQVTSHWWKGLVSLDGIIGGDSPVENSHRPSTTIKTSYQQQLDTKIRVTEQKGIVLGLPTLCRRLQLTPFEKNLVLMALAPEINRRYGRIYNYLQETEQVGAAGLPTIDLILRILCRTDREWQTARLSLGTNATLLQQGVVLLPLSLPEPFLAHAVKLPPPLVEYLLTEQPNPSTLEHLLQSSAAADSQVNVSPLPHLETLSFPLPPLLPAAPPVPAPSLAASPHPPLPPSLPPLLTPLLPPPPSPWARLILPDSLLAALRHLCDRVQYADQIDQGWRSLPSSVLPGTIALWVGPPGTGKTTAAQAIAQTLRVSLVSADLAVLSQIEGLQLLQQITSQAPAVLLLKSAQVWLGRSTSLAPELIRRFLQERLQNPSLTLLCTERRDGVKPIWRRQITPILEFPLPDTTSRLALWQQAFPAPVSLAPDIHWRSLARLRLTGAEIQAIARDAAIFALAESPEAPIGMKQLLQACELHGLKVSDRRSATRG